MGCLSVNHLVLLSMYALYVRMSAVFSSSADNEGGCELEKGNQSSSTQVGRLAAKEAWFGERDTQ